MHQYMLTPVQQIKTLEAITLCQVLSGTGKTFSQDHPGELFHPGPLLFITWFRSPFLNLTPDHVP